MLSLRVIPRGISHYLKQSTQQLHSSVKVLNAKDSSISSSSSDSSDSDSDKDVKKAKEQVDVQAKDKNKEIPNAIDSNERLNTLLQKIAQASVKSADTSKTQDKSDNAFKAINVAIKPKAVRFKKIKEAKPAKEKPYEEQLKSAAKDVAQTLKGDTQKTEAELLSLVLNNEAPAADKKASSEEETPAASMSLSGLLSNMKVDNSVPESNFDQRRQKMASKLATRYKEPSVAESLLYAKSIRQPERRSKPAAVELKAPHADLGIFKTMSSEQRKDMPQLSTWEAMETREMKLASLSTPQNVFQELIQWTEQGKLWRFPINNEQGMEEEEKVHFSEHVFMERHLKDWCPKRGPIRHFMELVCVGLSKNPYMTVEEKIGHITWYRNYFEDKKDLLHELGVLDDKAKVTKVESQDKKQIQG